MIYSPDNDPIPLISNIYIDLIKMCYEGAGYYLLETNNELEYKNYFVADPHQLPTEFNDSWISAVEKMGKWYEKNIHTYQGTLAKPRMGKKWYACDLISSKVADDCSGFVQACLRLFGIDCPSITTSTMNEKPFMDLMEKNGFQHIDWTGNMDILQNGDIMCGGRQTHTEIFAGIIDGKPKSWGWGNIHDGQNGHPPMPCGFYMQSRKHIWRKT